MRTTNGETPLTGYEILSPEFDLCSIQLTDAVQRTLNEYSSTNGLEIVFPDWSRTSAPLSGTDVPVSQEARIACSRALQCFAVVIPISSAGIDSFASLTNGYWKDWQFRLGNLYFPYQRCIDKNTVERQRRDNMYSKSYMHVLDAFDRLHPKAAPCMLSFRGSPALDWNVIDRHSVPTYAEHRPNTSIHPYSIHGKRGSYANGANIVACTLERSSEFGMSGIPVNNSRMLALSAEYHFDSSETSGTLLVFLKYVKLVRVYLLNSEVEQ
jgi:hypothetical protein